MPVSTGKSKLACAIGFVVADFKSLLEVGRAAPQCLITKLLFDASKIIEEVGEVRVIKSEVAKFPPIELCTRGASFT